MAEFLFLFAPLLATGLAGFLIQSGLRESRKHSWLLVITGLSILAVLAIICYLLSNIVSYGSQAGALLIGFFCSCVAVICAVWMIMTLKAWRKLAAIVLGVVFPLSMFYSVLTGDLETPETVTQHNGDTIIQAIYRYQASTGRFPPNLADLEPTFLAAQPEALTTQDTGWLYKSTGEDFTLGYWYWPDKLGAGVCLYGSSNPKWNCAFNNWGPFQIVWTPIPCRNDQGEWVNAAECK
jgi:hypothetical protein